MNTKAPLKLVIEVDLSGPLNHTDNLHTVATDFIIEALHKFPKNRTMRKALEIANEVGAVTEWPDGTHTTLLACVEGVPEEAEEDYGRIAIQVILSTAEYREHPKQRGSFAHETESALLRV